MFVERRSDVPAARAALSIRPHVSHDVRQDVAGHRSSVFLVFTALVSISAVKMSAASQIEYSFVRLHLTGEVFFAGAAPAIQILSREAALCTNRRSFSFCDVDRAPPAAVGVIVHVFPVGPK